MIAPNYTRCVNPLPPTVKWSAPDVIVTKS
jgi:hypothetical protein